MEQEQEGFRRFLQALPKGTAVAVEASGGWYGLMSELEQAGMDGHLVDHQEAKKRMRGRNKTDHLEAQRLAYRLYEKRLPEVWIPPAKLRIGAPVALQRRPILRPGAGSVSQTVMVAR